MDAERALVSRIITSGQLDAVIAKGINPDHFMAGADGGCREVYMKILAHNRKYKGPPSPEAFRQMEPGFELLHMTDSIEWICDRFIVLVKRRLANMMIEELAVAADDSERQENIDLEFLDAARRLATVVPSSAVANFRDMETRVDEYEKMVAEGIKPGIAFGFPTLDSWTGGMQPHEMVTVAAFSGVGKSTLMWQIAFNIFMQGKTPLIISLEMESSALLRRFDAMAANLSFSKMKNMELDPSDLEAWRSKAAEVRDSVASIPVISTIRHCTPDHVFAEAVRHAPDVVLVDYVSLMRSNRPSRSVSMWQGLTEVTQDLKQNARTLGIPHIVAAQLNRSGKADASLENMGYSLSIVQDSDIILMLKQDDDMKALSPPEMELILSKNREGRIGDFRCIWDHAHLDFREKNALENFLRKKQKVAGGASVEVDVDPDHDNVVPITRPRPRPRPS
jgi:replicative DNA helicase